MWLLDTNICIYLIKKRPPRLLERLRAVDIRAVSVSSITVAELHYGAAKSARAEQNLLALAALLAPLTVEPFDDGAAAVYGAVRADLERAGTPIGPLDMLIAAHALALHRTVVTNNAREFRRVPRLEVENWVDE